MQSEFKANQALADYNEKEYTMRQQWAKVLGISSERTSKLAAPVRRTERTGRTPCRWICWADKKTLDANA